MATITELTAARTLAAALLGSLVAACGGGGGGGSSIGPGSSAGIDGTGTPVVAVGTVTGFGSVIVNGVRYDTSAATFAIDGSPGTQADLAVGDVVLIKGQIADDRATGTADSVAFDDAVEGPIASIDAAAGTFVALGQTVVVSADTSFDDSIPGADLAGLAVGDIVEVSGLVASDGSIRATRVELKPAGGEFELTGLVSGLDAGARTFSIAGLMVDYAAATLEDFAAGTIADGDLVEVKGATFGGGGELIATRVEQKGDDAAGDAGDRVEIEGFVTRFVDAGDFDVAGLPATTTPSTVFEGGVRADLGLDLKVEVEGELDAAGVLVATKVDIRRATAVRVVALVDSVDAASDSFVVLGITVNVDARTRMEDKTSLDIEPFGVADLAAGDYVEVRGTEFPAGGGELAAALVEREEADTQTELQGFVTAVAQPDLTILGVTIQTDAGTDFEDQSDAPIGAAAFFSTVAIGSLVRADGIEIADTVVLAEEVELEDE